MQLLLSVLVKASVEGVLKEEKVSASSFVSGSIGLGWARNCHDHGATNDLA